MTKDEERWAEALAVTRMHRAETHVFVASRIGALATVGDTDGVERWRDIAQRCDRLTRGKIQ